MGGRRDVKHQTAHSYRTNKQTNKPVCARVCLARAAVGALFIVSYMTVLFQPSLIMTAGVQAVAAGSMLTMIAQVSYHRPSRHRRRDTPSSGRRHAPRHDTLTRRIARVARPSLVGVRPRPQSRRRWRFDVSSSVGPASASASASSSVSASSSSAVRRRRRRRRDDASLPETTRRGRAPRPPSSSSSSFLVVAVVAVVAAVAAAAAAVRRRRSRRRRAVCVTLFHDAAAFVR